MDGLDASNPVGSLQSAPAAGALCGEYLSRDAPELHGLCEIPGSLQLSAAVPNIFARFVQGGALISGSAGPRKRPQCGWHLRPLETFRRALGKMSTGRPALLSEISHRLLRTKNSQGQSFRPFEILSVLTRTGLNIRKARGCRLRQTL